ncbi:hypothetical protein TNCV_4602021 [Trichonephila clavipes]|nr:hypothetical protein TNCV_4602021 [Trichonephila clavipes]
MIVLSVLSNCPAVYDTLSVWQYYDLENNLMGESVNLSPSIRDLESYRPRMSDPKADLGKINSSNLRDCLYVHPLPDDLPDLRQRMEADFARISSDTTKNVWDELAYRLDLCRVTNGAHIEHL